MEGNETKMNGNERKKNGNGRNMEGNKKKMGGNERNMNYRCSKYRVSKCHLEHLYPCKFKNIFSKRCSKCLSVNIYI